MANQMNRKSHGPHSSSHSQAQLQPYPVHLPHNKWAQRYGMGYNVDVVIIDRDEAHSLIPIPCDLTFFCKFNSICQTTTHHIRIPIMPGEWYGRTILTLTMLPHGVWIALPETPRLNSLIIHFTKTQIIKISLWPYLLLSWFQKNSAKK